jgi:hypothetical protein
LALLRGHIAFQNNFSGGRKWKPSHLTSNHLYGSAAQPTDDVDQEGAVGHLDTTIEKAVLRKN